MKTGKTSLLVFSYLLLVGLTSCVSRDSRNRVTEIESKIKGLISQMTLDEKIGQMSQADPSLYSSEDQVTSAVRNGSAGSVLNYLGPEAVNELQRVAVEESRLHIPLLIGRDVIHGFKTVFPIPLGMASSWNPELVRKAFEVSAEEAASYGVNWTYAPMIDITWDPRWGRIAEGCGEDPFLASQLASAMVKGLQGSDPSAPESIAACAKHFAGYGFIEGGMDYTTTYITEPIIRNVVLKPFKAALDAGALTFMTSFSDLNGIPATGNRFLVDKILREEWGFDGLVISDWGSIPEMVAHGYCTDYADAAEKAIQAGVDVEMATSAYSDNIKALLDRHLITIDQIDKSVANILRVKFKLGLFENPYVNPKAKEVILSDQSLAVAKELASESCVLLKNDEMTLPFDRNIKSLAVIGPLADSPRDQLGTWCFDGDPANSVTPLKALRGVKNGPKINWAPGLEYSRDYSRNGFREALNTAKKSDAIVFFAGEEWVLSGEARCRGEITLPGAQSEIIDQLASTGKPMVVVIMAGRPLAIGDILDKADAVLYAWHGGTMAGPAIADLLLGIESPSGKLPVTFVKGAGQIPFYYYKKSTARPASEESWTHIDDLPAKNPETALDYNSYQLDYGYTPLFPFGFGLSYTTFEYSDLKLSTLMLTGDDTLRISATISNTGNYMADEIVQLYIHDRVGSITRPVKELKSFERISLDPGSSKVVLFKLTAGDLAFFNGEELVTESGEFDVWIGPDSDSGLHGEFMYKN